MGDDNNGTANDIILGAGSFGNNMHFIGDDADGSGTTSSPASAASATHVDHRRQQQQSGNDFISAPLASPTTSVSSAAQPRFRKQHHSPFGGFAQNFVPVGDGADDPATTPTSLGVLLRRRERRADRQGALTIPVTTRASSTSRSSEAESKARATTAAGSTSRSSRTRGRTAPALPASTSSARSSGT